MQRSNTYILIYTTVLCLVCAISLALVSTGLTPQKDANKSFQKKYDILSTFMETEKLETLDKKHVEELYSTRINSFVVDASGNVQKDAKAENINVAGEYKKLKEIKSGKLPKETVVYLPVYEVKNEKNISEIQYYIVPTYGFGLWDVIWSYVCFENDFNTIKGIKFDHKAETPGLGARIKEDEKVFNRYKGKKIWDGETLKSVTMQKGEGNDYSNDMHSVDGMSGATLTGDGVDNMFVDYFTLYSNFIKTKKK